LAAAVRAAYGGGLRALGADTDALSNRAASAGGMTCLLLGGSRLSGHGTGGDAILGRLAAQDDLENLRTHLQGARTVVVTACLGGGTGGGATPEIVKTLRDMGIAALCFVTRPFGFEGDTRGKSAERVLPLIEENADSLVVVPLDELFDDAGEDLLLDAVQAAEGVMAAGITLLWRLVTKPGFIQLDAERLHAMVLRGGNARFGFGAAEGADRAERAVAALKACRLLRSGDSLARANAVMLGILAGRDLRLAEVGEIMAKLRGLCKKGCHIEMGTVLDDRYDGRVELVALSFESWIAGIPAESRKEAAAAPPAQEPPVAEAFPIQPGGRRGRSKGSKLSFGATGRGKFQGVEPTLFNGQDLDVPTYIRRGITLER
jgi:cell division protein FtsZ